MVERGDNKPRWAGVGLWLLAVISLANVFMFIVLVPLFWDLQRPIQDYVAYRDALSVALELGRLDLVTGIVTALGIGVAVISLVGFIQFREIARDEAARVAERVARKIANEANQEYAQAAGAATTVPEQKPGDIDVTGKVEL